MSDIRAADALVDEYLECLMAPLVGAVPYEQRARFRQETQFHLERLREDLEAEGMAPLEAARQALASYGPSHELATNFLETWFRKQPAGPLAARLGNANAIAFANFGLLQLACVALFQLRTYAPATSAFSFAMAPADFYATFGEGLPLPDLTPASVALALLAVWGPWVAGALTGMRVPVHAAKAAYHGLLPCVLYSLVAGVLSLPMREVLLFAVFQVFYWLPIGMGSAKLTSVLMRLRRARLESLRVGVSR